MNNKEKKLAIFFDNLAHATINVYFYFYFVISILIIITYFLGLITLFNVLSIIMFVIYMFELFVGFDRNLIGITGVIFLGIIGYLIFNDKNGVILGITIGIFIVNALKVILNIFINRRLNK